MNKTRDKLIEVARQLFARKGIENTTMNDIAAAGGKGRRTLYTYFKSKSDIFAAVTERESEQLVARLRQVAEMPLEPEEQLRRYLEARFEIISDVARRPASSILNIFSIDYRRFDRIRRLAIEKETAIFRTVLARGVEKGVFRPDVIDDAPLVEAIIFQGVDYSHLRDNFADLKVSPEQLRSSVVTFLVNVIIKK